MGKYILNKKTQNDIDEIFVFVKNQFEKNKAIEYLIELRSYLDSLAENPKIGKNRKEIKQGLFSFPYKSHIIFYRILSNHIRIVRILHGSKDIPKYFKKWVRAY